LGTSSRASVPEQPVEESSRHTHGTARRLKEAAGKASYRDYARQVAFWTKHFRGMPLDAVTRQQAADLIEEHSDNPATRNRYIACLRAILRKAAGDWEWLDRAPKLQTYAEAKQRIRWITEEEAERLLAVLPEWLASMARFALATGLRQSNVLSPGWDSVDLERRVAWVHPDQARLAGQSESHSTRTQCGSSGATREAPHARLCGR
jgi:integrase